MRRDHLRLTVLTLFCLALTGLARGLQGEGPSDLLDEFRKADVSRRLALLPRLTAAYPQEELPPEARYLLALQLLRPHLTWNAPNLVLPNEARVQVEYEEKGRDSDDRRRWGEAFGAEGWMFADVPPQVRNSARAALLAWPRKREEGPPPAGPGNFTWQLKDPRHPDVASAVRFLSTVREGDLGRQARRWVEEIARNNTVLTLDVIGAYGVGQTAPVLLDVRNAPRVRCKLYRVHRPEDLLWVTNHIGTDFVYRDHGLQHEQKQRLERLREREKTARAFGKYGKEASFQPVPEALTKGPVWEFEPVVADLKVAQVPWWAMPRRWHEELDYRSGDGDYFEDACERHRERLDKVYRPATGRWTSWQCNRVLEVPGKALAEAGAYVLAVESGGQTAYAPLVVEPLSLTLRRCRDGVFAAVADTAGQKPVVGATAHGREMLGSAVTDAEGIAFAKLYAGGDRAIIVHKEGRFAVGGFGRVFEGLYFSPLDHHEWRDHWGKMGEAKEAKGLHGQAQLYADRQVVAAFTERPTYRPDQEVQFKVIVRRLAPDEPLTRERPQAFRAEDFELASRLEVPAEGTQVPFALLDPKGRAVATGELTLNDFGTAAGKARLNAESAVGTYALRLRLGGVERIVPEVCAVEYYRLPSFQLTVKGVPEKVRKPEQIRVELSGTYYFGKPLAGGRVEVQLLRGGTLRAVTSAEAVLDVRGQAVVILQPEKDLPPGRYLVRCDLSDESDRSVHRVLPYTVEAPARPGTGLGSLPRFVPLDRPLELATTDVVLAERAWCDWSEVTERRFLRFAPRDGKATLRFPAPGWYMLSAGKDQVDIFVHGGTDHPSRTITRRQDDQRKRERSQDDETDEPGDAQTGGWVDLTDDRDDHDRRRIDRRDSHLWALFDRQEAQAGNALRVLVYVPAKKARVLFTLEGFTILDYFTAKVEGSGGYYHVIDIPIKRRHLPHFYLRGRLLEGEDVARESLVREERLERERKQKASEEGTDPRWCRIEVTDPKALPGGETLRVETTTERTEYKPGENVAVRVRVTNRTGSPAAAEVSLAAIDASVYAFGEDRLSSLAAQFDDPHPPQRFYAKAWRSSLGKRWALLVERGLYQDQDKAIQELAKAMKVGEAKAGSGSEGRRGLADFPPEPPLPVLSGEMPVASMPLARLRSDFRETAAWLPQLRTDANGEARATFKLPDTLTRYRVSAVALTKDTKIGTGRAELQASLSLAVQVMLPRFAVEGDRLAAIGVVHNNGRRDRVCQVAWRVEGAVIEGQLETDALDEGKRDGDTYVGRLKVPAGQTARVGLWLQFNRLGQVKVDCRCVDGADSDGEVRTLTVQPLGRERLVSFDGAFTSATKVQLPAGFAARDVRVVLSRNNVARSLDGIAGLVEYPYGCVEQSMSRFLPAVLVREASRRTPLVLPAEVAAKLPQVLEQGLTRLYKFQHADGGWGWWEHDKTDPRMTVYVVYGLARCAAAGVPVDADVLSRGCTWLRTELRDSRLAIPLAARAWLALAHAGKAEASLLLPFAERLLASAGPAEARCHTALACKLAGLSDVATRLWAATRDWQPDTAEEIALLLKVQVTFGDPLTASHRSAARLMKLRTGLGWENTQATAAALDALSLLIPQTAAEGTVKAVHIKIAGREVLNLTQPEDLQASVYRARLSGERLPVQDPLEIELVAEAGTPLYYTIEAPGTQRQDKVEPLGDAIRVTRTFETVDGRLLPEKLTAGQTLAVRVSVVLDKPREYVLIEDRCPAGCEFADTHLYGKDASRLVNVEFRDDRFCAFATSLPAGRHELVYFLRAETPGLSQVLPGCVYPMYQDKVRGETGAGRLEIVPLGRPMR